MDTLNDDFATFNAYPGWYKDYEYLGKSTVLVVANSRLPWWAHEAIITDEQMPRIDLALPYWNIVDDWEPREVHIVKAIPRDDHPYGHKIATSTRTTGLAT